jgi:hypothetical protein
VLKSSFNPPLPHLCAAAEAISSVIGPTAKSMAGRATEAREGIGNGVGWLLWPSSDDLEAIGQVSVVDRWLIVVVLCVKKYRTFVRSSQKNKGPHQPATLPPQRNL